MGSLWEVELGGGRTQRERQDDEGFLKDSPPGLGDWLATGTLEGEGGC